MASAAFLEGILKAFTMILASEIGDKTFFIAAVLAMKNSRRQVGRAPCPGRCQL